MKNKKEYILTATVVYQTTITAKSADEANEKAVNIELSDMEIIDEQFEITKE